MIEKLRVSFANLWQCEIEFLRYIYVQHCTHVCAVFEKYKVVKMVDTNTQPDQTVRNPINVWLNSCGLWVKAASLMTL